MYAKSLVAAGLAAILFLGGCGTSNNGQVSSAGSGSAVAEQALEKPGTTPVATTGTSGEDHHLLVAYYSATGNTKAVAETIAETLGADVFEITPAEPYTQEDLNYRNDDSRVSREHEDPSLQDVELATTEVENWDSYDVVFLGAPIWWGRAAWPVNGFVKANDFTGKSIYTFVTSSASGIGDTVETLAHLAGTGTWEEGRRFSSHPAKQEVAQWAEQAVAR